MRDIDWASFYHPEEVEPLLEAIDAIETYRKRKRVGFRKALDFDQILQITSTISPSGREAVLNALVKGKMLYDMVLPKPEQSPPVAPSTLPVANEDGIAA